jgi:putative flippase GtrA
VTRFGRFARFNAVGAAGFVVQLATLGALVDIAGMHYLAATVAAVGAALVHNFLWHRRWTWRDRARRDGSPAGSFWTFVAANGVTSLTGSVLAALALTGGLGVPPVAANLVAVAACAVLNFWSADRFVFRPSGPRARYSVRSASVGLSRDARHAGMAPATRPIAMSSVVAPASAAGSRGESP